MDTRCIRQAGDEGVAILAHLPLDGGDAGRVPVPVQVTKNARKVAEHGHKFTDNLSFQAVVN